MNTSQIASIHFYSKNSIIRIFFSSLLAGLWLFISSVPLPAAASDLNIKECFEGPATEFAGKFGKQNTLAKSMYEMKAGSVCAETASLVIHACLLQADKDNNPDGESHYACIGKVANPCIDSAWGTDENRHIVCVATEEKVWLDILNKHLDAMLAKLPPDMNEKAVKMKKAFFSYRNEKCGLVRMLKEGNAPNLAYGACTTETAARFAIDLRETQSLVIKAAKEFAQKEYPGNRLGVEKLLRQFFSEKTDRRELTMLLRPAIEDYDAAYEQPLAGKLERDHQKLWSDPRTALQPKKEQTDLILTVTTSDKLKAGDTKLASFPEGYKSVLSQMKPGLVIAAFKFVVPGEKKGMAFDGLIHVNGRWVLIPKPWRSLR